MADEPTTPASGEPAPPTTPASPAAGSTADPVKMAEELGALKETVKEYESYRQKVDPVLETLWSDQELLAKATESHNKRLGKPSTTPPDDTKPPEDGKTTPQAPVVDQDARTSQINMISERFEEKTGITKLPAKEQVTVRGAVGQMLKEMLDPKGNKTIGQVFEEVSLTKLPWYLERAYDLISKDSQIKDSFEKGKQSVLQEYEGERGSIGSLAGGSVPIDEVQLSPQEKKVAANMGVSEEDYLKRKKDILQARNA